MCTVGIFIHPRYIPYHTHTHTPYAYALAAGDDDEVDLVMKGQLDENELETIVGSDGSEGGGGTGFSELTAHMTKVRADDNITTFLWIASSVNG